MKLDLSVLASGMIENIGAAKSTARLFFIDSSGRDKELDRSVAVADHRGAITVMGEMLQESGTLVDMGDLAGIGHRVVHGGEAFHEPIRIDERVIKAIEKLIPVLNKLFKEETAMFWENVVKMYGNGGLNIA